VAVFDKPATIIPNEALQTQQPAYQSNQPSLQFTGGAYRHSGPVPGMPQIKHSTMRRWANSPQGVQFAMGQQAQQQHMADMQAREDNRFNKGLQAQTMDQEQAKRAKQEEDARADRDSLEMAKALSGSLLEPGDYDTLARIPGAKARMAAMETLIRLRNDERDRKAKAEPSVITTQDVPGTDTVNIFDRGHYMTTVGKAKQPEPPLLPPPGMERTRITRNGETWEKPAQVVPTVPVYDSRSGKVIEFPKGYELPAGMQELQPQATVAPAAAGTAAPASALSPAVSRLKERMSRKTKEP
jgi:hypothetical protein